MTIKVEPLFRGSFNRVAPKPVPMRKHRIVNYNAKEDIVECTCEFIGTAEAFEGHNTGGRKKESSYTNVIKDIKIGRENYYLQGSSGFYRAAEDKIFD